MLRSISRLAGACSLLACLSFASIPEAQAHYDDAYYHDYGDLPSQGRWMSTLHDATPLREISMPGTHGSAARHGGWFTENQTLTISKQLEAGIRFLDLRTRHYYDTLEMHHGFVYQHADFPSVLDQIVAFVQRNPSETVFIRVKEEYSAHGNTRHFEGTVNSYYPKYGQHFVQHPDWDMPLGQARGKIVLLRNFAGGTLFGSLDYHWQMARQDDYHVNTNWDLHGKWEKVKQHINVANSGGPNPAPFVNFLSASGGSFPYFVASGHSDPRTDAPGLSTGMVTPFFNGWYPDFPRGACFIGMCTIFFEGTNTLTKNYLQSKQPSYVGIIAADFPGPGLIQEVINVNHNSRGRVSESNGKCLDINGGLGTSYTDAIGRSLISWTCHGNANQRFTVRGKRIMVGLLCLDVEGAKNEDGARVILWPCHSGSNQWWKVESNGQIRSMASGIRCLDINARGGHEVGLRRCSDHADQKFRVRRF